MYIDILCSHVSPMIENDHDEKRPSYWQRYFSWLHKNSMVITFLKTFASILKCASEKSTSFLITKTYLYNFDPFKPHFYIVKLGFTGVYIIFFYFCSKHRLWVLVRTAPSTEPPRRGGSNEYPQSMFWAEIWKISEFLSENFQFLVVKFSIYFNRHVFVMLKNSSFETD